MWRYPPVALCIKALSSKSGNNPATQQQRGLGSKQQHLSDLRHAILFFGHSNNGGVSKCALTAAADRVHPKHIKAANTPHVDAIKLELVSPASLE